MGPPRVGTTVSGATPRLIAHRGFADLFPENTVRAAVGAARRGATMVEVDCRRCGSGEVVVHHDETVDRVTDGTGPVAAHTAAELGALSVRGTDAGVPTLAELVAALPAGLGLNLELKERGLAADALAAVRAADGAPGNETDDGGREVLVSSFDPAALAEAGTVAPERPRALIVDDRPRTAIRRARRRDCTHLHPRWDLCLRSRLVGRAHRAGLTVNAWTLDARWQAWLLGIVGVDGLIADTPGVV